MTKKLGMIIKLLYSQLVSDNLNLSMAFWQEGGWSLKTQQQIPETKRLSEKLTILCAGYFAV